MARNPLLRSYNYLYFLGVLLFLMGVQVFYMHWDQGMDLRMSLADAIVHWSLLGLITFGLINTFSFYQPPRFHLLIALLAPLILVTLWGEISLWIFQILISEDQSSWLELSLPFRVTVSYLLFAAAIGFSLLWYRLDERNAQEKRQQEIERMSKEAELFKLRQQIQPHFLFNALNSINSLIGSRPKDARQMTQKLSEFLRGTLRRENTDLLSLEEEINHLNLYLDLEQVRFGHRLKIEREIAEDCIKAQIPSLLIQPLIENAIKYGLYGTTENLVISLRCWISRNSLQVEVQNPFEEESSAIGGTGFGLPSINRRLYLIYGRTDLLETKQENGVFTAQLSIPQSHVQSTDH